MKKFSYLLLMLLIVSLSGCTIDYSNFIVPESPKPEEPTTPPEDFPVVVEPTIGENALFYPSTLNIEDNRIQNYSYIDENLTDEYKIYSAYYSETYDTIYIAYDLIDTPVQTLKAKDLYEIENHAITYFVSDTNRSEDTEYLKAVRIYPDRLASSCRKGADDDIANQINGCADYGSKEAIIDLNNIKSMDDFYNEKRVPANPTQDYIYEPMRDTFAHEYGHVSTFYHMVYKNDENYEDYLKLRLGNYYSTVYPSGLPGPYSSENMYNIQPEEILADDFVELFYKRDVKDPNDNNTYTFEYTDLRNSLSLTGLESIQYLKNNNEEKNIIKTYYENNFLNYNNKTTYDIPKIISSSNPIISYYDSYSKISNTSNLTTINSKINVNLIAVGEVTIKDVKYYRVILSNTFYCLEYACDMKDVGEKMGYVEASLFTDNTNLNLYKVNMQDKNSLYPIKNNSQYNLYLFSYYDFSYVLTTSNDDNYALMYDYLTSSLQEQTYQINLSFLTKIN